MAPAAADAQEPLERPLGVSEELWHRAYEMGTGIVQVGFGLGSMPDVGQLQSSVDALVEMHPFLGAQIVKDSKGKLRYKLKPAGPSVLVDPSLPSYTLPWASRACMKSLEEEPEVTLLQRVMELGFSIPLGTDIKGPADVFQVWFFPASTASFGGHKDSLILLRAHGGSLDRQSVGEEPPLEALVSNVKMDDCAVPPSLEDLLPCKLDKGFFQKGIDAQWQYEIDGLTEEASTRSAAVTVALLSACEKEGTTVHGAECAALLKAVAAVKGIKENKMETYGMTSVFDVRKYLEPPLPSNSLGMFYSALPAAEKVGESTDIWDLARQISQTAAVAEAKGKHFTEMSVLNMLFSQALKHPALTPDHSLRTSLVAAFTNAPHQATWRKVDQICLNESLGPFASIHGVGPCIALGDTLQAGPDLHLGLVYAAPLYSRKQVKEVASLMRRQLMDCLGFPCEA
eukprot:SM000101S09242  [mRNA]  locus=s101:17826:21013:- [translate_table: standard]